jgi:hypothetical protein
MFHLINTKKMKKIITTPLSFCVLFAGLTLSSCGGGTSTETKTTDSIQSEEKVDSTASTEKSETENKEKEAENPKQQIAEGKFVGIEQGDYFYFRIQPESGEEMSFMVLQDDETYQKISANPEKFKGVKVKVYWENTTENIPESGGKMEIQKYIKAEILE